VNRPLTAYRLSSLNVRVPRLSGFIQKRDFQEQQFSEHGGEEKKIALHKIGYDPRTKFHPRGRKRVFVRSGPAVGPDGGERLDSGPKQNILQAQIRVRMLGFPARDFERKPQAQLPTSAGQSA